MESWHDRQSENSIPHTSYVGGINMKRNCNLLTRLGKQTTGFGKQVTFSFPTDKNRSFLILIDTLQEMKSETGSLGEGGANYLYITCIMVNGEVPQVWV